MSKTVKNMMVDMYKRRFGEKSEMMLVDIRGIDANTNNEFRSDLSKNKIRVTVVKNRLAQTAFVGTDLEALNDLIDGPTAVAYGIEEDVSVVNVARVMVGWAKKIKTLDLKGAVLDGTIFGPDQIKALSDYPTKDEAQAKVVQLLLSPASKIVGQATAPASNLAGILKTLQEKLEDGESIEKVA